MSKTYAASLQTHLDGQEHELAWLILMTRTDGTSYHLTTHPAALVYNGDTYTPTDAISATAIARSEGMSPDNLDVSGLLGLGSVTSAEIRARLFNDAQVWIFHVKYTDDPITNIIKLDYGHVGEVTLRGDNLYVLQFRSLMQRLDQQVGQSYSENCPYRVGDADCGVVMLPSDWLGTTAYVVGDVVKATVYDGRRYVCTTAGTSGATEPTWNTTITGTTSDGTVTWTTFDAFTKESTVSTVTSQREITTGLTDADDYFSNGVLTFTSGLNSGLSFDVKRYQNTSGTVTLIHAAPFTIAASDAFSIEAGCNNLLKMPADTDGSPYTGDCIAKFDAAGTPAIWAKSTGNTIRFGGFPVIPGNDFLLSQ